MSYIQHMLGQHEKIVFVTHQHWMTLLRSGIENFILALLIAVVVGVARASTGQDLFFIGLLLWVFPVARFVYHFLLWDNREYIITNRRVIQVAGVFSKNVTDSSLEKVNDVKLNQSILGRALDYGDLEILTASELAPNLFRRIASPIRFKTEMLNQKEAFGSGEVPLPMGQGQPTPGVLPPSPDVPTLINQLDQLRQKGIISEEEFQSKKQELLARI